MNSLRTNKWTTNLEGIEKKQFDSFCKVKLELSATTDNSILLKGSKIVIPKSLHCAVVDLAHETHQGIVKTKSLLREKVWFPNIDQMVESKVKECDLCKATTRQNINTPLQMSPLPAAPWLELSIDFCGPVPTGEYVMVVVDDFSRFPMAEIISTVASTTVVPRLENLFSLFGIPEKVRTDNGPPFNGSDFAEFAARLGFKHRKITPYHPQANGEVERMMRTLKKSVQISRIRNRDWKKDLQEFMRDYRATPHTSTKVAPGEAMFGRSFRTKIPEMSIEQNPKYDGMRQTDFNAKAKMKKAAERKINLKPLWVQEGDSVLVKQAIRNKFTLQFDPQPYIVQHLKETLVTAKRGSQKINRNISHFTFLSRGTQETGPSRPYPDEADVYRDIGVNVPQRHRPIPPPPRPAEVPPRKNVEAEQPPPATPPSRAMGQELPV